MTNENTEPVAEINIPRKKLQIHGPSKKTLAIVGGVIAAGVTGLFFLKKKDQSDNSDDSSDTTDA